MYNFTPFMNSSSLELYIQVPIGTVFKNVPASDEPPLMLASRMLDRLASLLCRNETGREVVSSDVSDGQYSGKLHTEHRLNID